MQINDPKALPVSKLDWWAMMRLMMVKLGRRAPLKPSGIYANRLRGNWGSVSPLAIGQSVEALREPPKWNWTLVALKASVFIESGPVDHKAMTRH